MREEEGLELPEFLSQSEIQCGDLFVVDAVHRPLPFAAVGAGRVGDDEPRFFELAEVGDERRRGKLEGVSDRFTGDVGVLPEVADRCGFDVVAEDGDGLFGGFTAGGLGVLRHAKQSAADDRATQATWMPYPFTFRVDGCTVHS